MSRSLFGLSSFSLALLYCALLVAGNLFVYHQQKNTLFSEFEDAQAIELKLLEEFAREGLITQNYAMIEWYFKHWGEEYGKVVSLSLENSQGYALIKYQRAVAAEAEMLVSSKSLKLHDGLYRLKISSDTVELNRRLDELLVQLFLVTAGATIVLIVMLWFLFQAFAVRPLQDEIRRRQRVERKLKDLLVEK